MIKHVLFVQGGGADVHDQWDHELVASLERELGEGYGVRYPRMPNEADPGYSTWAPALLRELDALEPGAVVVGHSVGGAILIHLLARHSPRHRLSGIFLIAAPFLGEGGWPSDDDMEPFADLSAGLPAGAPVFLYHGLDDETVPIAHLRLYARALPHATARELPRRDHQLNDDLSEVARDIWSLGRSRDEEGGD